MTIESATEWIKYILHSYLFLFVSLLAVVGFFLGFFSLSLFFIQETGSLPNFLITILKGYEVMIWIGIVLIAFRIYIWLLRRVVIPIVEEKREIKEIEKIESKSQIAIEIAKETAKEIKKLNKRGKK